MYLLPAFPKPVKMTRKGHGTSLPYRPSAEWQASREAREETPPQVARMTNRFPHFLVYPVAALI